MKPLTDAALYNPCPHCRARAGTHCVTDGRRHLRMVHTPRLTPRERLRFCARCRRPVRQSRFDVHLTKCGAPRGPNIWRLPRPSCASDGAIYLLETLEGPARVKVGICGADLRRRLISIASGSPVAVQIRAVWGDQDKAVEWELHQLARRCWVRGEWFTADAALIVESHMDGIAKRTALPAFLPGFGAVNGENAWGRR